MDYIEIFSGITIGVIGSLLASALWYYLVERLPIFSSNRAFSISGIWVSLFRPTSSSKGYSIEIIRIRQSKERVSLYIENYNSEREKILRLKGHGIYRGSLFGSYYYFPDRSNPDIGTFTLKSLCGKDGKTVLKGVYTQFIEKEHFSEESPVFQTYILKRVQLPLFSQIRIFLGLGYLSDYDAAKEFIERNGFVL